MSSNDAEAAAAAFFKDDVAFALGSQFMAAIFDALFAGVIICQLTHWIPSLKYDSRLVRCIIGVGGVATLLTTSYTWANYLMSFCYEFGHFERFASLNMLGWYAVLDMFTVVPVQIFFGERAVRINKNNKIILAVISFMILATASAACTVTVVTRNQTLVNPSLAARMASIVWPAICIATHLIITTCIVVGLLNTRSGVDRSNKLITRLVVISLESQLPATIFGLWIMTTITVNPKSFIIPWIIVVHPKVFMVGCLSMVNLRHTWRQKGEIPSTYHKSQDNPHRSAPGLSSPASSRESNAPSTPKSGLIRGSSQRSVSELEAQVDDLEMDEVKA